MSFEFESDLDLVVARTRHEPFRQLLGSATTDQERANVRSYIAALAASFRTGDPIEYAESRPAPPAPAPIAIEPTLPSLGRQFVNFATAVVTHVAAGSPMADPETVAARLAICETCPQLIRPEYRCGSLPDDAGCGCHVRKKAEWADQHCPATPPKW